MVNSPTTAERGGKTLGRQNGEIICKNIFGGI